MQQLPPGRRRLHRSQLRIGAPGRFYRKQRAVPPVASKIGTNVPVTLKAFPFMDPRSSHLHCGGFFAQPTRALSSGLTAAVRHPRFPPRLRGGRVEPQPNGVRKSGRRESWLRNHIMVPADSRSQARRSECCERFTGEDRHHREYGIGHRRSTTPADPAISHRRGIPLLSSSTGSVHIRAVISGAGSPAVRDIPLIDLRDFPRPISPPSNAGRGRTMTGSRSRHVRDDSGAFGSAA